MLNTVYSLACSYAVSIVGVSITVIGFKLSAFFPSQIVTAVGCRVALSIISNVLTVVRGKQVFPSIVAIFIADLCCFGYFARFVYYTLCGDVTVVIIFKLGSYSVLGFSFKLTESIVGIESGIGYGIVANRVGLNN